MVQEIPKRHREISTLQNAFFYMGEIEKNLNMLIDTLADLKEKGSVPYVRNLQNIYYELNAYLEGLLEAYEEES